MFEEDDSDRQVRYVNAYEPPPSPRSKSGERESHRICGTVVHQLHRSLGGEQQNHAADAYGHGGYEPRMDAFAFQESKA